MTTTPRSEFFCFGAAVLLATMITVPAGAAPISGEVFKQGATTVDRQIDVVHYRARRHCHWRHGHRHCHGYRPAYRDYDYDYDYDPYFYGPYFYGYPGNRFFGFGHHHHHGHHGGHHGRH